MLFRSKWLTGADPSTKFSWLLEPFLYCVFPYLPEVSTIGCGLNCFLGNGNNFVANLIVACYLTKKFSLERGPVQMITIIFSMSNPVAWMAGFRIRPNQRQWSHKWLVWLRYSKSGRLDWSSPLFRGRQRITTTFFWFFFLTAMLFV